MKIVTYILCFICLFGKAQDNVLTIADSMPKFPEGNSAIANFIQKNMIIPPDARKKSNNEKTFIKFIVDTSGKVVNPIVIKPSGFKSFDQEAIRIVSKMPQWEPGFDKGKKVNVYMILPISYKNIGIVAAEPVTPEHEKAMKYWNEGRKLELQLKFDKALVEYNKALDIEPHNNTVLFDKAKMLLAMGEKNKAGEIWKNLVEKNVRKDEAEGYLKKYCAQNSDPFKFSTELKSISFFNYGMDNMRSGRYESALRKFDSSLKYSPDHTNALFNKAEMHNKLNQPKVACVTWKKLLELSPEDKEVEELIKKNCN
ncbi:MAG: TonB family protein [Bacteroidetes bacterium]|nr:TonB family protein [Bacteroidota bacterium]